MADSVLDLTTDTERPTVKVDGVPYPLKGPADLTLLQYRTIERIGPRIAAILLSDDPPDSESLELEAHLVTACRIALDAPAEILERLGALDRILVFRAFMELLSPSLQRTRAALGASPSHGMNSSLDSRVSTGATRRRGSRRSRSGSSART